MVRPGPGGAATGLNRFRKRRSPRSTRRRSSWQKARPRLTFRPSAEADFPLPTLGPRLRGRILEEVLERAQVSCCCVACRSSGLVAASGGDGVLLRPGRTWRQRPHAECKGHVLGHVQDFLGWSSSDPNVRIYQTPERQGYHTDSCDIVGLLCLQPRRKQGDFPSLVSSVTIFNEEMRPGGVPVCSPACSSQSKRTGAAKCLKVTSLTSRFRFSTGMPDFFQSSTSGSTSTPRAASWELRLRPNNGKLWTCSMHWQTIPPATCSMEFLPGLTCSSYTITPCCTTARPLKIGRSRRRKAPICCGCWLAPVRTHEPLPPVFAERYGTTTPEVTRMEAIMVSKQPRQIAPRLSANRSSMGRLLLQVLVGRCRRPARLACPIATFTLNNNKLDSFNDKQF